MAGSAKIKEGGLERNLGAWVDRIKPNPRSGWLCEDNNGFYLLPPKGVPKCRIKDCDRVRVEYPNTYPLRTRTYTVRL